MRGSFRLLFFVVLVAAFGGAASATMSTRPSDDVNCLIHKADFSPPAEGLRSLKVPLQVMAASPLLAIYDKNGKLLDRCSGAVISDGGHILTAGHCLDRCLKEAGAFKVTGSVRRVDREALKDAACHIEIDGKKAEARILARNDCSAADFEDAACDGLDYAILQVNGGAKPCFELNQRNPAPGTPVLAIGYPDKTRRRFDRPGARDSDGVSQWVSAGQTIGFRPTCRTKLPNGGSTVKLGSARTIEVLKTYTENGTLIQATADLWKGQSGGGLVDSSGRLVGVGADHTANRRYIECEGSGFFTSGVKIREHVAANFPQVVQAGAFNCRSGRIH